MEVKGSSSPSRSKEGKRLCLHKAIQASFGSPDDPDYVFDIASSWDGNVMAVSLSTSVIKLYSPGIGRFIGDCIGHSGTISDLLFPDAVTPHCFFSSSCDGTIRLWDSRTGRQISLRNTCRSSEIFSISFGGTSGNILAAGGKANVICWDWRAQKELACMEDCHTEDVTQVRFHPTKKGKLVSASVDGLICVFDTHGQINDDEGLEHVMGLGTSISKVGFYGTDNDKLWCLTHIETLSIWDVEEGIQLSNFHDTRSKASANWSLSTVDYLVDCHYSSGSDSLWLIAGDNMGSLGYFQVCCNSNYSKAGPSTGIIGPVNAVLEGGHSSIVRTVWSLPDHSDSLHGLFCWSGGEDGLLCSWSQESDSLLEKGKSWASRALLMKKSNRHKRRHQPY